MYTCTVMSFTLFTVCTPLFAVVCSVTGAWSSSFWLWPSLLNKLPLPLPYPYPYPYPTLPLPYPTLPYLTLPYPYLNLPYPTPTPTLPYPYLKCTDVTKHSNVMCVVRLMKISNAYVCAHERTMQPVHPATKPAIPPSHYG